MASATSTGARLPESVALDIGAAGGGNTRILRDLGMLAVPVENGFVGGALARDRGLPAVLGDACQLPFRDSVGSLVVAFDVLEHLVDDATALGEMRRVLTPGGRLLVAVPADMRLWSAHDVAVGHMRRYSREGLIQAVQAAGFRVDSVRSWNVLLRPVVAARRRRAGGSDLQEIAPVLDLALRGIVACERLMPWLHRMRGVSLLLSAHRP